MKPQKSQLAASVDRFVADIADIIRRHAERVVADALARHGLAPTTRAARGVHKTQSAAPDAQRRRAGSRERRAAREAEERVGPRSRRPAELQAAAEQRAADAADRAEAAASTGGPRSQRRPEQLPLFR